MFVILNREAFETALIKVPFSSHVMVGIVPHRVRATDPCVKLHLKKLQCFVEDFLESDKIALLAKNLRSRVGPVEGLIKPTRFVGSW